MSTLHLHRLSAILFFAACLPLTSLVVQAAPSRAEKGQAWANWKRTCERRAEENAMRQKLRRPFVRQCIAGYRINAGTDLQSRKEKF